MKQYVILLLFIFGTLLSAKEDVNHGGQHKHPVGEEHDPEFDHDAVIGSKKEHEEFDSLPPEESKRRLGIIVDQMDTDKDGKISRKELVDWVYNSFTKLDAEEAGEYFKDQDKDEDGVITFSEYTVGYYGYEPHEADDWENDNNEQMKELHKLIKDDEVKFKKADKDGNGALNLEEYNAFYHPWDHEYMHSYEIERTLEENDVDHDGFINMEEYIGSELNENEEDQLIEKENFKAFDKDGDNKLNAEEIKDWVIPDHMETAEEEAEHLIQETDVDTDGMLSKEEILEKQELWVGSAATDYGTQINEKFHDPSEL